MRLELEPTTSSITITDAVMPEAAQKERTDQARESLADGIKAAQAGDRAKARTSLLRTTELDPSSESAWLWLASISEYPEELLVFLTNVLDINPDNQRAIEWTTATKSLLSKTFVQHGIDAVEENRSDYAAQCFSQALEYDQNNSMAWLWMASLSDSSEGKIAYFEKVLTIDAANETALSGFQSARYEISQRQLAEARSAAVEGRSAEANEFLDAIIAENPDSEDAWILRAHLAQGFEGKIYAYEKVLDLNPANTAARSGLDSILSIIETVAPKPALSVPTVSVPVEEPTNATAHESGIFTASPDFAMDKSPTQDLELPSGFIAPQINEHAEAEQEFDYEETLSVSDEVGPETDDVYLSAEPQEAIFAGIPDEEPAPVSNPFTEIADEWPETPLMTSAEEMMDESPIEEAEFHHEIGDDLAAILVVEKLEAEMELESAIHETVPANAIHETMPADAEPYENGYHDYQSEPIAAEPEYNVYEPQIVGAVLEDAPRDSFTEPSSEYIPSAAVPQPELQPLNASVISVAGEGNTFSHVTFCSFCNGANDAQTVVCQTCMAVLTLSDLEMLISNTNADKLMLRDAVERMESDRLNREFSETELTMLGIGHLNLRNLQYGFNYLNQASQLNPNNVVLGSQVNALLIRLEEIKKRDEVQDSMPKGKTILVVDDSPTVRKLIAGKLEKCGHEVFCAGDGVEAIERLEELVPDLILLDITMPRMDGYQVCKLIRSNSLTRDVPVVMISGKDGFFDKVRGRMAGTTGYITKPFGPETLMKAVETYLATGVSAEQVI